MVKIRDKFAHPGSVGESGVYGGILVPQGNPRDPSSVLPLDAAS